MEKRESERFKTDLQCRAEFFLSDAVKIKNLSLTGICIITPKRLNINRSHKIRISNNGKKITPACEIVRCFLIGNQKKYLFNRVGVVKEVDSPLYEVVLKFSKLNDEERYLLDNTIRKYTYLNRLDNNCPTMPNLPRE